jgi:hypothetical protein
MGKEIMKTNVYTYEPSQHPNILLGSLQLLFWFTLRPSVWTNQIKHFNSLSTEDILSMNFPNKGILLIKIFKQNLWREKEKRRFLFQVLFLIPVLSSVLVFEASSFAFNPSVSWGRMLTSIFVVTFLNGFLGTLFGLSVSMHLTQVNIFIGLLILSCKIVFFFSRNPFIVVSMIIAAIGLAMGLGVSNIYELSNSKSNVMQSVITQSNLKLLDNTRHKVKSLHNRTPANISMLAGVLLSLIAGLIFTEKAAILMGQAMFIACLFGYAVGRWRAIFTAVLFVPWHMLIYQIDQNRDRSFPSLLPKHLAFWDEFQDISIWGPEKHLLLIFEKNPIEGQAALNYLSTTRQRWAAQSTQIELDGRQLEKCSDTHEIGEIQQILTISELASPAETIFRSFNSISADTNAALSQTSTYNQRLALTEVTDKQLNNFVRELTKSSDKYAVRFRPIAQRWQNIIDLHLQDLIKESELRQEIDSPYIIGVPVTNRQQLFIGRTDISERLEKLLLDRRSPPLLLYGQRRTGKTSLLNNLGRLLPTSIIPLFVDLQGSISSAKDHTGFLYNLAKAMINSAQRQRNLKLPPLSYETLATDPFTRFDEWLDNLETALAGNTALLALDEFEVLDRVLNEGRFNENDVLGMLRNLIQHRPTFKVLLAGSHTLDEFQRWSSYLINAQVIHLGYLQEAEARQLIETPIENFALRYEPSASQRVLDITKGHPFLVQLLCAEIVALKNDQDPSIRRLATLADVEAAIPEALEHGSMFFSDIERNQLDAQSLQVLRYFAQQGEAATISKSELEQRFSAGLEGAIDLLLRRELLEIKPSGFSIQLELIRRWFT